MLMLMVGSTLRARKIYYAEAPSTFEHEDILQSL